MELESGTFVKLLKPEFAKTYGQGKPPEGIYINAGDDHYSIPYGTVLKLSEKCDEKNKIANLKSKPYPLIHIKFVEDHIQNFELIKFNNNKESEDL